MKMYGQLSKLLLKYPRILLIMKKVTYDNGLEAFYDEEQSYTINIVSISISGDLDPNELIVRMMTFDHSVFMINDKKYY